MNLGFFFFNHKTTWTLKILTSIHMTNGDKKSIIFVFCLSVWGFSSHSIHFYSFEHHRWTVANLGLCLVLMAIALWGLLSLPYLLWHGPYVYYVISEDTWHSHVLPSVYQWICHNPLKRLESVVAGFRTPKLLLFEQLTSFYYMHLFYLNSTQIVGHIESNNLVYYPKKTFKEIGRPELDWTQGHFKKKL